MYNKKIGFFLFLIVFLPEYKVLIFIYQKFVVSLQQITKILRYGKTN